MWINCHFVSVILHCKMKKFSFLWTALQQIFFCDRNSPHTAAELIEQRFRTYLENSLGLHLSFQRPPWETMGTFFKLKLPSPPKTLKCYSTSQNSNKLWRIKQSLRNLPWSWQSNDTEILFTLEHRWFLNNKWKRKYMENINKMERSNIITPEYFWLSSCVVRSFNTVWDRKFTLVLGHVLWYLSSAFYLALNLSEKGNFSSHYLF